MAKRPHLKLNIKAQLESIDQMKFNYGFGNTGEPEPEEPPQYELMIEGFRGALGQLNTDRELRIQERNPDLAVPSHIDYIQIEFQDQFNIAEYQRWMLKFGLLGVNYSHYNRKVLFAVVDEDKFQYLLSQIEGFIIKESGEDVNQEYEARVRFIRDFELLTTDEILNFKNSVPLMFFQLVNFPLRNEESQGILEYLFEYLDENAIDYVYVEDAEFLEVYNASDEKIAEIVQNFDVVLSVTSSLTTIVRPSELNIPERAYGFELVDVAKDLPIIGIIDTGISTDNPLSEIIIKDDRFNITATSSFEDNANNGLGHGTAVAALASLGEEPYKNSFEGTVVPHARLLPIKILDKNSGYISINEVLQLLEGAKQEYPEIKIFTLTISFESIKSYNEDFSSYAYKLDKFAHENDCLIFISTANNNRAINEQGYNLSYFYQEHTNLCSPSESMNNVVVGAAADNLENGAFKGIALSREFPAMYTRKSHLDLQELLPQNKQNKNLFRPDVIAPGGDYEEQDGFILQGDIASMQLLSANSAYGYFNQVGTSFATPLAANLGAQIQRMYPNLGSQTIKALIINAASLDKIPFHDDLKDLRNRIAGHGIIEADYSIQSTDNLITLVIEDDIEPNSMKVIPLNFPDYLSTEDLGKKRGILKLKATLCFSFDPVFNNHLAYCPIQMGFSIFRNHSGEQIVSKEDDIRSKLKVGWSQNNRWKSKPIPASNSQKIEFPISVKDLQEEGSTFKLAIHCLVNSQIIATDKYEVPHNFSMAISIKENLTDEKQTGRLYDELSVLNNLEVITDLEAISDLDLDT